jgi:hypothetical protein
MVEKQASSEIAQSRERFEEAANNLLHPRRDELEHDALGGYKWADVECMWRIWQAAERDTRERCAQIADLWAKSKSCDKHDDDPCCHVRTGAGIAERIRGKESA